MSEPVRRPGKTADNGGAATYILIHGAGDVGWYWHRVEQRLRARGHDVVACDLPVDDDSAGLSNYADVVVAAARGRNDVVVVSHSFGSYVAPLVGERLSARLLILVAPMVPTPGESAEAMFDHTGYASAALEAPGAAAGDGNERTVFYHDVEPALAAEALARGRPQSATPGREPWPLAAWPRVPTRCLLCRDDRLFPVDWLRRVVRERLGVVADEMEGGHTPALSRPDELVRRLEAYRMDVRSPHDSGRA